MVVAMSSLRMQGKRKFAGQCPFTGNMILGKSIKSSGCCMGRACRPGSLSPWAPTLTLSHSFTPRERLGYITNHQQGSPPLLRQWEGYDYIRLVLDCQGWELAGSAYFVLLIFS